MSLTLHMGRISTVTVNADTVVLATWALEQVSKIEIANPNHERMQNYIIFYVLYKMLHLFNFQDKVCVCVLHYDYGKTLPVEAKISLFINDA